MVHHLIDDRVDYSRVREKLTWQIFIRFERTCTCLYVFCIMMYSAMVTILRPIGEGVYLSLDLCAQQVLLIVQLSA